MTLYTLEDLQSLARKELQALAKERGIKANAASAKIISGILELQAEGTEAVAEPPVPPAVEEPPPPVVVEEPPAPMVVEEPPAPMVVEKPPAPMVVEEPPRRVSRAPTPKAEPAPVVVAPPVAAPPPPPPVEVAPAPAPAPEPARAQLHPWERKPLIPVRMKANKTTPASRPGTAPPASNVPVKSATKPVVSAGLSTNGANAAAKARAAAEKARSLQAERDAASKALAAASKARREAFEAQRKLGAPPKPGAAWEQGPRKSPRKLPHHKSPVKGKADAAAARWARAEGYLAKGHAQKQAVMTNARWRN